MRPSICFVLLVIFVTACNKNENPTPDESGLYLKLFGHSADDAGFSVFESSDGNYVISGSIIPEGQSDQDLYVVKIDKNGNQLWERIIDGGYADEGKSVIESTGGNYLVVGSVQSKEGSLDMVVFELDSGDGSIIKSEIYGETTVDERGYFITNTTSGHYVILGSSSHIGSNSGDMMIVKTDLVNSEWERKIGLISLEDSVGAIRELDNGNLLWVGTVFRSATSDLRIIESDPYGNLIWDYGFNENDNISQSGNDMQVLENGYLVVGSVGEGENKDILLIQTNQYGEVSSGMGLVKTEMPDSQEAFSVTVLENGYVVSGYTSTTKNNKDILVCFYDLEGHLVRQKVFGGAGDDVGRQIMATNDGGFLVVSTVTVANNTMIGVYKLNSKGELVE